MASTTTHVDKALLANPMTFEAYYQLSQDRFAEGRTTSEDPHYNTDEILDYAKVNLARMKRLLKTIDLSPGLEAALAKISKPQTWVLLTESWCGDAAQLVPLIAQMAEVNPLVTLQVYLRDQNLGLMDQFLTNGGRSIPKLIALEPDTFTILGTWGPRPAAAQYLMDELKKQQLPFPELATKLHSWYADDQTMSAQAELTMAIDSWA